MSSSSIYIMISIVTLAVIAAMVILVRGRRRQVGLSRLGAFAFALVLAGIVFGENRMIGYGLMSGGVMVAVIGMSRTSRTT